MRFTVNDAYDFQKNSEAKLQKALNEDVHNFGNLQLFKLCKSESDDHV